MRSRTRTVCRATTTPHRQMLAPNSAGPITVGIVLVALGLLPYLACSNLPFITTQNAVESAAMHDAP
ncbi:MAG: hypothetical protein ACFB4J_19680 [Elainellaceae cyanobacterium]